MSNDMQATSGTSFGYLQQLQLTREPFAQDAASNQDEFFLLDTERAQRLNMLYHMSQNSELLLVVTGIKGIGKTSLLHRFIEMRTDNWRQCIINANTMTNPDQLLIEIAEGFGLPQDTVNFGSGLEMLQKRLTEMKLSELMPILIIDDAHELPTASLTILLKLSELADNDERLLRIVLFGEPNIMEMFNAPELKEVRHRITHTLTMPILTEQQSVDYIQYRLSVAGLQGDSPFSQGQMKRIHRKANGIPGLINKYAQEILLSNTVMPSDQPPLELAVRIRSVMSIVIILAIAGSVTWYLSRDVINSLNETRTTKLETLELPLLPPSSKVLTQSKNAVAEHPLDEPIVSTASTDNTDTLVIQVSQATADKKSATNEIDTTEPLVQSELIKKSVAVEKTNSASSSPEPAPIKKSAKAKAPSELKASTAKTSTPSPTTTTHKPLAVKKDWLSQQNKNHYTLQIMGSRQRRSLSLVQRAHKIGSQSAIIRTKLNGKDWYILIYQAHPTKQQARNAARILPPALRLTQPWPRRLGDIKSGDIKSLK